MIPKKGEIWRHYQGTCYLVLDGDGRWWQDGVEGQAQVVYQEIKTGGRTWMMPLELFLGLIDGEESTAPRFIRIH